MCDCESCNKATETWAEQIKLFLAQQKIDGRGLLEATPYVLGTQFIAVCPTCGQGMVLKPDNLFGFNSIEEAREFFITGNCPVCQSNG